jgi:hypothetical protein
MTFLLFFPPVIDRPVADVAQLNNEKAGNHSVIAGTAATSASSARVCAGYGIG